MPRVLFFGGMIFRKIFRFGVTIWRCEDMYIVEASLDANQKRIEVSPMGRMI